MPTWSRSLWSILLTQRTQYLNTLNGHCSHSNKQWLINTWHLKKFITVIDYHHHWSSSLPSPSLITIIDHDHHNWSSLLSLIITIIITIDYHHHWSSLIIITFNDHHQWSPSLITIIIDYHHHWSSSPLLITISDHHHHYYYHHYNYPKIFNDQPPHIFFSVHRPFS